jgi:hypothetical protein
MQVKTFQLRLWMTWAIKIKCYLECANGIHRRSTAVHLLATLFILVAICAAFVHIYHRYQRQDLNLLHQPGTIASAVSIGAQTGMGQLLAQQRNAEDIQNALQDKRFRIDPLTMKIVMHGEQGYETVGSPLDRRRSVFASMQGKRSSRRFSRAPGSPLPSAPQTPQSTGGAV